MTTYEDIVTAVLPSGLVPLVVPQLRTITLGGRSPGWGSKPRRSATDCRTSPFGKWKSSPVTGGW